MNNTLRHSAGFTLVEVALIVTILGLIIAPFFNFLAQNYRKDQVIKSEKQHDRITAALSNYVAENQQYPCPASPNLNEEANQFGIASCGGNNVTLKDEIYYGALPVHTLRLSSEDAVNNYGWKYLYAVSESVVNDVTSDGKIIVKVDVNGDGTVDDDDNGTDSQVDIDGDGTQDKLGILNNLPFVIINPGKDGKGSASRTGSDNYISGFFECDGNADDAGNCDKDGLFVDMRHRILSNVNHTAYYDDTIMYSLIRQEGTFWTIDPTSLQNGRTDMIMRNDGNVVIGPDLGIKRQDNEKLYVFGGDIKVRSGADTAGTLNTTNITVDTEVRAPQIKANKAGAAEGFFYD